MNAFSYVTKCIIQLSFYIKLTNHFIIHAVFNEWALIAYRCYLINNWVTFFSVTGGH